MKTLASLQDFFYENIYPDLKYLEEKRLKIYNFLQNVALVLFIITCSIFFIFRAHIFNSIEFIAIGVTIPFAMFMFMYKIEVSGFASLFKDALIEKIVKFIDDSLVYKKNGFISEYEYKQSALFSAIVDKYNGDDLVSGTIKGVDIHFSEVHTQVEKKSAKGKTYWSDIFKGLIIVADFNKNFQGKTVVFPDNTEKFIGSFSHFFQSFSSHGELVKLDSPDFEKEFVVYSNDQIEARYILSHSLMQNILQYKKLIGRNLSLSFVGSKIYIAIGFKQKLFEPKIYKSIKSFDEVKIYFQILSLTVDLVNILKLNRRIWSKR